ncbi:MAG TPA: carbohydrate-binding family 9-like protein [Pyrinomonadaceae bacterium]|nr:carbohydrate-binding family 9-like protein [Pyrinomonadaceae bacterium]
MIDDQDKPVEAMATATHVATDFAVTELDHPSWKKPQPIKINRYWSGVEAPQGRTAEAKLLWSDKAIHVRYVCNQTEPLVISENPVRDKKTRGLWDRDVCEIFLAPDPSVPERYFEFEAAPTGEWIDLAIHTTPEKRDTDWDFHSSMSAAARVEKERVIIAMRIPWDHWIHKPQHGERWRVNLFRCVGKGETRGYLAWRPTLAPEPAFHVPSAFGWLRFA